MIISAWPMVVEYPRGRYPLSMYGWLEVSGSLRTKKAFIPMNPMKILGWYGEMIGMTRNCLPKTLACSADIRKVTDDLWPYQVVACALWG